jgi:DNA-binding NarL/FixJ family response regulator
MGVRKMLETDSRFKVLAEAGDGIEALREVDRLHPEVLLLDLSMPQCTGMDALRELMARQENTKTVLLTGDVNKNQMLQALQLGARGILTKSALTAELHECIHAVIAGRYWAFGTPVSNLVSLLQELMKESDNSSKNLFGLTAREVQITSLVAEGCTNKDVARESKISEETVKHHLKKIFDKTGVSNRLELAIFAMNHSLVRSS